MMTVGLCAHRLLQNKLFSFFYIEGIYANFLVVHFEQIVLVFLVFGWDELLPFAPLAFRLVS